MHIASACCVVVIVILAIAPTVIKTDSTSVYYPSSLTDISSASSTDQTVAILSVRDQEGTQNNWENYIEFYGISTLYSGIFTFVVGSSNSTIITCMTLDVNFLGVPYVNQGWEFEVYENAHEHSPAAWVKVGNTSSDVLGFASWKMLKFFITSAMVDLSRVLDSKRQIQIRFSALSIGDNCDVDFVQLSVTSSPPSTIIAPPDTRVPGSARSVTKSFALKMLIVAKSQTTQGVDFVVLAFNSTGVMYDFVAITTTTSLSTYLDTTGIGKYAGIVSVGAVSAAQRASITQYQVAFGVKWVVVGSNPSRLPGLTAGKTTTTVGSLTLAPGFTSYASCLKSTISVDTASTIQWSDYGAATIMPATIASTAATAAIMVTVGSTTSVAVAQIHTTSGTYELHYFVSQSADYHHSRAFAPLMVNWLSPAQCYQGARRLTLSLQADDLFLASFLWDTDTHSATLSEDNIYRLTDVDLQALADYYDALNPTLPEGSHMTMEWPFNGAGTAWYIDPDTLYSKVMQLQNKFWFVSHTWDHPCDLDTAQKPEIDMELDNNIAFTSTLLSGGTSDSRFSSDSLVNPCITGLFNPVVLQSMVAHGIVNCVGDNSVANLFPDNKYHGIPTTVAMHGYAGVFIIPRQGLDVDYDTSVPVEVADEYNTVYQTTKTFEQIMAIQLNYALSDKLAFRHDPYMMHQANGRTFHYADPVAGITHDVSCITLWTDRVVKGMMSMYNLPIVAPKMSDLAQIWRNRLDMDMCGFSATVQTSDGYVTAIQVYSTSTCLVGLSGVQLAGPTVTMEYSGPEITAWIHMTANVYQTLTLITPKPL